jgi:hypothetical protein
MRFSSRALGLVSTALLLVACGGSSKPAAAGNASAAADQRLQGNWRLTAFQPSLELEEPLKGLLDAQLKTLLVSFSSGQFSAQGPSVNTGGRYEITGAQADSFNGRVYDRAGAGYGIAGQFVGQQLDFVSQDSPWGGHGVLEHAP